MLWWAARLVHCLYLFSVCINLALAWEFAPDVADLRDVAVFGLLTGLLILSSVVGPWLLIPRNAWFLDYGGILTVVGLIVAVFGPLLARGLEAIADERDCRDVAPGPDFRRVRRAVRTWADGRRDTVAGRVSPLPDARGRLSRPKSRSPRDRSGR